MEDRINDLETKVAVQQAQIDAHKQAIVALTEATEKLLARVDTFEKRLLIIAVLIFSGNTELADKLFNLLS